ncbi:MAG: oxidase [Gemmataceae bacterium]|nr:oxidase [Gemmataceae bacterium]
MSGQQQPIHQPASLQSYFIVFTILMVLTAITVYAGFQNYGVWNTPVALGIAVIKAALVILIFMHALHSPPTTWLVILASIFFLAIMLGMTLSDYMSRGMIT